MSNDESITTVWYSAFWLIGLFTLLAERRSDDKAELNTSLVPHDLSFSSKRRSENQKQKGARTHDSKVSKEKSRLALVGPSQVIRWWAMKRL